MSNEHFNRSSSKNRYHWLILLVLVSGFFILGFSLDSFDNILNGIIKIIYLHPYCFQAILQSAV